MDPVLEALEHYRLTVSPEQKAADLKRLEEKCHSDVDAFVFVEETLSLIQQRKSLQEDQLRDEIGN